MGKFDDVAGAYFEGLAADKFGVDWRQKRKMLEAQTRGVEATTGKTLADTAKVGVETQNEQFDLQEKQRKLAELKNLVALGKIPATQLDAVRAIIAQGEADLAKHKAPYEEAHLRAQTNQANATADYMRRRPAEGSTGAWKPLMRNGRLVYHNLLTGEEMEMPDGTTDLATGRANLKDQRAMGSFEQLLEQTDRNLKRYEQHFEGFERITPSFLNPDKAVAKQAYESKLQELAQIVGRTILGDNRVSDQDRQVYTAAIGQANELLMTYDPAEARRRFNDLKNAHEDYKRKYMNPTVNMAPMTSHSPGGTNNVDSILDQLFPPRK